MMQWSIMESPYQKALMLKAEIDDAELIIKDLQNKKVIMQEQYINGDKPFDVDKEQKIFDKKIKKYQKLINNRHKKLRLLHNKYNF